MKDERSSVIHIFRKQIFDAIKILRKDKEKRPDGKTIYSYITQHNATSLDETSVLYAIKLLLKEKLLKNTPTKGGGSYYEVSEDSSTTVISDNNVTESNSQEETPSNDEIPKLGETSIQNIREHESSEKITISMLQAEFLTFKDFVMGESSNMNTKISGIFLNSGKQKETKELENLKTENENKTLIIKSVLQNLSQLASSFQKNHDNQNDIKVTKTIFPEEPISIEPKKTFRRNPNCQNSSCNEPLTSFNGFEFLHHDKTMPNNTNYSKENTATQSTIQSNNVNFKETRRPQVVLIEFPERQHTFQRHKIVPSERPYSDATNPQTA